MSNIMVFLVLIETALLSLMIYNDHLSKKNHKPLSLAEQKYYYAHKDASRYCKEIDENFPKFNCSQILSTMEKPRQPITPEKNIAHHFLLFLSSIFMLPLCVLIGTQIYFAGRFTDSEGNVQ